MDHFPDVELPYDPVLVPYLGGKWDHGIYEEFGTRHGLDMTKLQAKGADLTSQADAPKLLQAWLFFGTIEYVLQIPVQVDVFTRETTEGNRVLSTKALRKYLALWKNALEQLKENPTELELRRTHTIQALNSSHGIWASFSDFASVVGQETNLAVQLLGNALSHAALSFSSTPRGSTWKQWIPNSRIKWRNFNSNAFLDERMIEQGWCPSIVGKVVVPNRLSLQYYLSLLGRPHERDHKSAGCTVKDKACRASSVGPNYKPRHVCGGGDCEFLKPDMTEVCRIVNADGTPLLLFKDGELKVVEFTNKTEYTALSHVWADGLGNPKDNALPRCQIERLVRLISKLPWTPTKKPGGDKAGFHGQEHFDSQEILFWIDPICVPLSRYYPEAHATALGNMAKVYKEANRVLVLDSDLMKSTGPPPTGPQFISDFVHTKIIATMWSRRFWTLQEALFARRIWFQFENDVYMLIPDYDYGDQNGIEYHYDNEVGYYCDDLKTSFLQDAPEKMDVVYVRNVFSSLGQRVTTYPEDVPICIAILLNLGVKELLDFRVEERIPGFWKLIKIFPAGLLCYPCKKLSESDLRWAFASLDGLSTLGSPVYVPVFKTPSGLSVNIYGFTVDLLPGMSPKTLIAVKIQDEIWYIRQNTRNGNKSWDSINFSSNTRVGVILGRDPLTEDNPVNQDVAFLAAMVSIVGKDNDTLNVKYLAAVSVVKQGSDYDIFQSDDQEVEKKLVLQANATAEQQHWLIIPSDD